MKNEELSKTLKAQAVGLGLCEEWTRGWGNPDPQGLIDKYLHGIDFCIKHGYPGDEFIKRNFDKELLHRNHIHVDEEVHLRNPKGTVVLLGKCRGMLLFDGWTVCRVYVLGESDVTIDCGHLSKVFVDLHGCAKSHILQDEAASVYVYKHGDACVAETKGDVCVRNSEK